MSLRVLTLLLLGLAGWQFAWAEQAPPAVDDAADYARKIESAPPRGLFYEISKDGASAFLFGTLHVGKPDFFPLERAATQALVRSTVLAVEVDVTQAETMQAATRAHPARRCRGPAGDKSPPGTVKWRVFAFHSYSYLSGSQHVQEIPRHRGHGFVRRRHHHRQARVRAHFLP